MFQCEVLNNVREGLRLFIRPLLSAGQLALEEATSGRRVHFVLSDTGRLEYLISMSGEEIDRGVVNESKEFERWIDWVRCSLSNDN